MQPASTDRSTDRGKRIAQVLELAVRNDAMLCSGQSRQLSMRSHFFPHTGNKCDRNEILPPGNVCSLG
jgi:hypothetical protein